MNLAFPLAYIPPFKKGLSLLHYGTFNCMGPLSHFLSQHVPVFLCLAGWFLWESCVQPLNKVRLGNQTH